MPRDPGFSLLEALVALGLLATISATALHVLLGGVHSAREAAYRTQAVLLAEELIARARLVPPAERAAALAGGGWRGLGECSAPEPAARARGGRLALSAWRAEVACTLPEAEARIDAGADRLTVAIRWRPAHAEEPAEVTLEARL